MQQVGYVFVELYVEDSRYYLRIFRDALCLEIVRDEGDWVELRSSHGTVILNQFDDPDPAHPFEHYRAVPRRGVGVEIGIVVADLRGAWERASAIEGCHVTPIVRQQWGMTDFRILTPHGYYLRVTTPRD